MKYAYVSISGVARQVPSRTATKTAETDHKGYKHLPRNVPCNDRRSVYSIVTMMLFVVFGVLAGMEQPNYELNLPTPMMGIFERINIYGYMLWIIVFSKAQLQLSKSKL